MLPRVADSLSFLYLENVRVVQDDTGVCAYVEQPDGGTSRVYLPVAAISCTFTPLGTVLGVFTLIVLFRPSVKTLFGLDSPPPAA